MPKIIIGLTGLIASGKDVSKKYLEQTYGAKSFRFSTILRDVLTRLDLPISRDNTIKISTVLRENFGQELLAKVMAKDVENATEEIVVADGARRLVDIAYLNRLPGFVLVSLEADPKTRYERMLARNENTGDHEKTFADFQADHERETELTIPEVMAAAKYHLKNDGSLEDLYRQLDKIISELK